MAPMHTTLISARQLQALQASGQDWLLFDCSFDLMNPTAGGAQFLESHLLGARRADLDQHLSGHDPERNASAGRHPLPERAHFAAWLRQQGLNPGTQVVVYDRQGVNYCGRLWWMLKWCGFDAVAVLDGGLAAWQALDGELVSGSAPEPAQPGCFETGEPLVGTWHTADISAQLGHPTMTLIDARATPRFRGETETIDPVAGHIPGALNRPFAQNIGDDGRFKPAEQLRAEFSTLLAGRDPRSVVHHCGSGVSAIPNLLAMELAGLGRSALYPGSWSEWCRTPSMPVARS
jgi:thiosulfate/3-mercaptopyruvate sulfurtransferase